MFTTKKIIFVAYIIYVLTITIGEAADCNSVEFKCKDGQCIDSELSCDGKKDCADGSDEILNHCFKLDCPDYSFRCAYGACIEYHLKCDGKQDCADGSDEFKLQCWNATSFDGYFKEIQGECDDYSMQCPGEKNKCVGFENICDGEAHCLNKEDESPDLCTGIYCPKYAYRCGTGACINKDLVCNHVADCTDESDEIKEVCIEKEAEKHRERANKNCYAGEKCMVNKAGAVVLVPTDKKYDSNGNPLPTSSDTEITTASPESLEWFVVPHGSIPQQYRKCQIPEHIDKLEAFDYPKQLKYTPGKHVPSQTMILFKCAAESKLIGDEFNTCFDGIWLGKLPKCEPRCLPRYINHGISTIKSCSYKDQYANCKEPARPDTIVQYKCAPQYELEDSATTQCLQESTCGNDGKWSSMAPRCKFSCGLLMKNSTDEPHPWIVSIYQRKLKANYEMNCFGAILSPKIVISVGSCFDNTEYLDSLDYNIVEGRHNKSYNQFDGHVFRTHNVSEIKLNSQEDIAGIKYELAIFIIVNYFNFSPSVSPICFDVNKSSKQALILQYNINENIGEIIEEVRKTPSERIYLSSIVYKYYKTSRKSDVIDVSKFRNFIEAQINRYNYNL